MMLKPFAIFFSQLLINVSQRCSVNLCLCLHSFTCLELYSFKSYLFSQALYKASFSIKFSIFFFFFFTLLLVNHTLLWNHFWILPVPCGRDNSIAQYFPKCSLNIPIWNGIFEVKWFWKKSHILSHCWMLKKNIGISKALESPTLKFVHLLWPSISKTFIKLHPVSCTITFL